MFGKGLVQLKGLRYGVTGILNQALKRRENSNLIAETVDEYLTSKCVIRISEKVGNVRSFGVLSVLHAVHLGRGRQFPE